VTADEIPDPSVLRVMLRVNGQTLQDESCNDMVFDFSQLISFWSKSGLGPGDMIASGTPEGVALHRKPDPTLYYLKPGDHVEAEVDAIGVLSTHIV
jgi:2-keto-4-pentenoate hydratase/2-oxohepta-3-ene-1,7-dioic acid hydratase in catechol pathway